MDKRGGPGPASVSISRVYTRFFLAALRDVFLAFFLGAARFLEAIFFATFFLAGEVVRAPTRATAFAPLRALACIAVATLSKTTLAAAIEAALAVAPAVAAASATSPASTLVLSAAPFPAATTVSRALIMAPFLFISAPPIYREVDFRRKRYLVLLPDIRNSLAR